MLEPIYYTNWQKEIPDQLLDCEIGDLWNEGLNGTELILDDQGNPSDLLNWVSYNNMTSLVHFAQTHLESI